MGGSGSGRHWHYGKKATTDEYRSIDVRQWNREGLLAPHQTFRWSWLRNNAVVAEINVATMPDRVILGYRQRRRDSDWTDMQYPILLEWTDCHLGGQRAWFRCPVLGCGRRVAILYSASVFSCRHCLRLAYLSQREPAYDRAARRADVIRRQLGWQPGILNGAGWKPKGMHWKTYSRLVKEHDDFVRCSLQGILAWCESKKEPGDT